MKRFSTLLTNSFLEMIRQPVFLLLLLVSCLSMVFMASLPYFGLGDDLKLVKDGALAILFLTGLLGATLGASSSLAHEIRSGTALVVLVKPVARTPFLLAKFLGVIGALTLLTWNQLIAALLASRMGYDAYGSVDWPSLFVFLGLIALALTLAGFQNYILGKPFVPLAILWVSLALILSFIGITQFLGQGTSPSQAPSVEWRLIPLGLLIYFAICALAAIAMACSTRLHLVPTLAICSTLFLAGLFSDYYLGRGAESGNLLSQALYALLPNWQLFWVADVLQTERSVPLIYLFHGALQMLCYIGIFLSLAVALFDQRELS